MHVRQSIELAALISCNIRAFVSDGGRLSPSGMEQYWATSKCRLQRWTRALKKHSSRIRVLRGRQVRRQWDLTRGVLEEILTGEILTRVWAAACCGYERRQGFAEAAPIVRNIFTGHLEARQRALNLMVHGPGLQIEEAVQLNRLRRRNERWTDVLLGNLVPVCDVHQFAFSRSRVRDFGRPDEVGARSAMRYQLLLVSLRASYQQALTAESPNADLNGRIAAAILACFRPELFDSTGLLKSLWLARLDHNTSDTQGMIDELLRLDDPPALPLDALRPPADFPPRGDLRDS